MDAIPANASSEQSILTVPAITFHRLIDLLELAARRGAFEIEEYQAIGELYSISRSLLGTA